MTLNTFFILSATVAVFIGITLTDGEEEIKPKSRIIYTEDNLTAEMFVFIEESCANSSIGCGNFSCFSYSRVKSNITWYFKSCQDETCEYEIVKPRLSTSGSYSDYFYDTSRITVDDQDSGNLKCLISNSKNELEVFHEVPSYETENITLTQIPMKNAYIQAREIIQLWFANIQGKPRPEIILLANNQIIPPVLSPKYSVTVTQYETFVTFYVISLTNLNSTMEDVNTRFSLNVQNQYETVSSNLTIAVNKSNLLLGIKANFVNNTFSRVKCQVEGTLLPTDILWCFQPCLDKNCDCTPMTNVSKIKINNLVRTSYVGLDSKMRGYVKCLANNSVTSKERKINVLAVSNGFDILGTENIENVDNNTRRLQIKSFPAGRYLYCVASVDRHKKVQWAAGSLHEGNSIGSPSTNAVFSFRSKMKLTSAGTFFCKALTKNGTLIYKQIEIIDAGSIPWAYYTPLLIILVIPLAIYIILKNRKFNKLRKDVDEFNVAGLKNFEKGALEQLNPNLTIDDQADLLPYDKSYEFPVENLKLGEQIGAGAFGVVVKAEAKGILEEAATTTVAVKMVNSNIDDMYIKALASELKIMIHLGKHVNVVSLLGACTQNIARRELFVIVEFCRFGNLKNYLMEHRLSFVNQINDDGTVDFNIGTNRLRASCPDILCISSLNNSPEKSEKPEAPKCHNGKGPVCTQDLLIWSFQVARGMEYLSSRRVLHGDLAARNILLSDDNVVKICDFGLARNLYRKDIYKKKGDEMLPAKWMAIEAITDKIFSIQSDVWSFGIVLWEIFSLGLAPYPGIEFSEKFCEKLFKGYRMESPEFATKEMYEIMLRSWDYEPTKRPSFTDLSEQLGSLLETPIRESYIDMNAGYIKMNNQRLSDYLSMMSVPEFKNFSSPPRYINTAEAPEVNDCTTYL